MEKLLALIEQHPELKDAYDKLVELKGKLSKADIEAFLKERGIDLPDDLEELKDEAEKFLEKGKDGLGDAIKDGLGSFFKK